MVDKVETKEKLIVGMVQLQQDTGYGIQLADGQVIDLSNNDPGLVQFLAHLAKDVSDIKKNLG